MSFWPGICRLPWFITVTLVLILVLGAGAPLTSPLPVPRPSSSPSSSPNEIPSEIPPSLPATHPSTRAQEAGLGVVLTNLFRPVPRQNGIGANAGLSDGAQIADAVAQAAATPDFDPSLAIARSPRPTLRPGGFSSALSTQPPAANSGPRRGSVCGDRQIRGVEIAAITGRVPGCGQRDPVRISSVSGVRLTQEAIMNCNTATALNAWVREGVIPAVGRRGRGLEALKVVAHYACRTRNNQAGARISEHGKGHAIDISGIILKNGDEISVLNDWGNGRDGRILRAMHASACGPFGTVLGPEANRFHLDHFHVDTAEYRAGAYCR